MLWKLIATVINPRRACAASVTVVALCVCVCVCVCVSPQAILTVCAITNIIKDTIVLSIKFGAKVKICFSLNLYFYEK